MRGKFSAGGWLEKRWHRGRVALFAALLMSWHIPLYAAKWQLHPTLLLGETYTDNVALAPPGREESDYVTEIDPGVSLHGEGGRIKLDLNYRLQNLIYANDATRNASNHQLAANGNAELVKDIFFVDARSSVSQQIVDGNGRVGLDNLNIVNQADVYTYGFSPYLKLRLASYAEAELRYSDDHVENQNTSISDAESQQYSMHVNSGPRFDRLQWDAAFQQQDLNLSKGEDSRYQSANADARYRVLSAWNILVRGGSEDNSLPNVNDPHNGSYWLAGLEWVPSPRFSASATAGGNNWAADLSLQPNDRTSLHVGYRDLDVGLVRGPSWNVLLSHSTRRTTWRASYTEQHTTTQTLQLAGQQFFALVDSKGNPIVDPVSGLPIILVRNVFSLTDEDFLQQRGQITVTMNTGKSDIVFGVFNERRTFSISNDSEEVSGTTASWTWRMEPRTSTLIGGGWQRRNPANTDNHEDTWNGSIGLIRTISEHANASLVYSHLQHNTYIVAGDYGENRVALQLNMRF